ncbi:TetR/AcrR family transcriptional regulator C-terminal domain-containing protein [Alteromonas gracilis]
MTERGALTRERIVEAAAQVADERGLTGVSMRSVGARAGVEAMSLYHHVSGKDALLDALADWAFTRIDRPDPDRPWREAMTARAHSARRALLAHPWALGLLESRRNPGPATLAHHDAVLGNLRGNGFDLRLAAHAFSVLDAYVYGFVLTELNLPMQPGDATEEFVADLRPLLESHPHLGEMTLELVAGQDYAYADEFQPGLDLILDGLQQRLDA